MLARPEWNIDNFNAPKKFKISKKRKMSLTGRICSILVAGEPTYFAFEGPCRHGLRRAFIKEGCGWALADELAAEIVKTALFIVGAQRPDWQEGQPEWTQPGALPVQRDYCKRCAKPLAEGHWVFCSKECCIFYHNARNSKIRAADVIAKHEAERIAS